MFVLFADDETLTKSRLRWQKRIDSSCLLQTPTQQRLSAAARGSCRSAGAKRSIRDRIRISRGSESAVYGARQFSNMHGIALVFPPLPPSRGSIVISLGLRLSARAAAGPTCCSTLHMRGRHSRPRTNTPRVGCSFNFIRTRGLKPNCWRPTQDSSQKSGDPSRKRRANICR